MPVALPCPVGVHAHGIVWEGAAGSVVAPTEQLERDGREAVEASVELAKRLYAVADYSILIAPPGQGGPTPSSCRLRFNWAFSLMAGPTSGQSTNIIRHELGHVILHKQVNLPPSAAIPAWLNELSAIAFEDDASANSRLKIAELLARQGALIPISHMLTMPHPEQLAASEALHRGKVSYTSVAPETVGFYTTLKVLLDLMVKNNGENGLLGVLTKCARNHGDLHALVLHLTGSISDSDLDVKLKLQARGEDKKPL